MTSTSLAPRVSFKAQMLKVREDAIVHAVNRLLAEKGFDAMTVDEVAANWALPKPACTNISRARKTSPLLPWCA